MTSKDNSDDDLVKECQKRFSLCEDRESLSRPLWKEDLRFANGDPDNGYQWEDWRRTQREIEKRPCLTINKIKQHNLQITNDARQNKPSVRVYPVDDGADKNTAEIFNGIIRHIEANSSADTAYDTASEFAVDAGLGYWRITTDYADDTTFDQEIYIRRVKNPLNVYLDPDIQEADGSDARFGFVFEDISKDEFESKYPKFDAVSWPTDEGTNWLGKDTIRLCEYFKIVEEKDVLVADADGQTFKLSEIEDKAIVETIKKDESFKKRNVVNKKCKWYLIAGDQVIEKNDWLGKYIPIVRVVGAETEIDGKVDRKGHTRSMKDAQRMYNFWTSSAVEFIALQGKQPYLAEVEAIQGNEEFWDNLNDASLPYLPYNGTNADGSKINMPQRQQPPVMAQAYMQGMQVASDEMKMASGQYDATFGNNPNAQSGRALNALQRKGDNATFHFIDNVSRSIRFTGKILVDLIPKIYDTARVVRILGEDGTEDKAHIDPNQQEAYSKQTGLDGSIKEIYNPSVGRYDVIVAVGPSYGTKRQEAFQALTEMSSRNPSLIEKAGDLIMKSADFPMAEQIADRLEKFLPPEVRDQKDGEDQIPAQAKQQIAQMQDQIKQMSTALENAHTEVTNFEAEKKNYDSENEIKRVEANTKAYSAITDRIKVLAPLMTPQEITQLADATKQEAMIQPDPGQAPSHTMGIPEQMPVEPATNTFAAPGQPPQQ